jgi:hypothetical protein
LGSITVAVVRGEAAGALGTMTATSAPSTNTTASEIERLRLMVAPIEPRSRSTHVDVRGQPRRLREGSPFDIRRSSEGRRPACQLAFTGGASTAKMFSRLGFSQHPDQRGPKRPVLLAVDQELAEGAGLEGSPNRNRSRRPARSRAASRRGAVRRGERGRGRQGDPGAGVLTRRDVGWRLRGATGGRMSAA